jgi:hypothetical protein
MMIWKEYGSGRGRTLRFYPGIRVERLVKTMKNLREDSRSLGRDLNSGPPEYEAGVLTTQPRRSVISCN